MRKRGATGRCGTEEITPKWMSRDPVTNGTDNVPFVIRGPCQLAWGVRWPAPGGVVLSKLSKLLSIEVALSAPCRR
jgi:hypothetical protein